MGEIGAERFMNLYKKVIQRLSLAAHVFRYGEMRQETLDDLRALTAEELAEIKTFFPMPKFFVFGHARSGTTLLARLLRVHPEVYCNWQAHFFTRKPFLESLVSSPEAREWLSRRSNRWNRGEDFSPLAIRAVSDFMLEREARREGKTIVGDKSPNSLVDGEAVKQMYAVYPDGRLIYIVRDGRDTAISHRFQAFIDSPQHLSLQDIAIRDDFAADPEPFFQGKRSIFTPNGLRKAAENWARNVEETDALGKTLYPEHYLSLRYEDLLEKPYLTMQRVWNFLEVDSTLPELQENVKQEMRTNPDAKWQQKKAGALVMNLEKGKSGTWQDLFTERDKVIFEKIAGNTLRDWDYE